MVKVFADEVIAVAVQSNKTAQARFHPTGFVIEVLRGMKFTSR
jgi:hypothetical protein